MEVGLYGQSPVANPGPASSNTLPGARLGVSALRLELRLRQSR
jgi:hypothetical protein